MNSQTCPTLMLQVHWDLRGFLTTKVKSVSKKQPVTTTAIIIDQCFQRSLKNKSVEAKISVTTFARITGKSLIIKPYTSHMATPNVKMENIPSERSFAERDLQVFKTWGKKAIVVKAPATKPKRLIVFIF